MDTYHSLYLSLEAVNFIIEADHTTHVLLENILQTDIIHLILGAVTLFFLSLTNCTAPG